MEKSSVAVKINDKEFIKQLPFAVISTGMRWLKSAGNFVKDISSIELFSGNSSIGFDKSM